MLSCVAQKEIDGVTGAQLRLVLTGADEAHLLASEIAATNGTVSVILTPVRQFPLLWDQTRILAGVPLTPKSSIEVLLDHGINLGVGVMGGVGAWAVANTRFELGWVSGLFTIYYPIEHSNAVVGCLAIKRNY